MRILDENRQEITEYDLTRGCLTPATIIRPEAVPVDNVNKFVYLDEDPAQTPSAEDTILELAADHEYRICMLELNA